MFRFCVLAEQRELSGEDSQITREITGRLAPLRYEKEFTGRIAPLRYESLLLDPFLSSSRRSKPARSMRDAR